ncbi:hypothetical protein MTO96_038453 [Rhipicephalus appendiculatus]
MSNNELADASVDVDETAEPQEQTISEEQQVSPYSEQRDADVPQATEVEDRKEVQNAADAVPAGFADCSSSDAIMQEWCSRLRVAERERKDKEKKDQMVQMKQGIYGASTERDLHKK